MQISVGSICDKLGGEVCHMFRRAGLWIRQPGFYNSHTSMDTVGIGVPDIMDVFWKFFFQLFQNGICQKYFHTGHKVHVSVWPQKRGAENGSDGD